MERLFAWVHHFRRLVIRSEYHLENFFGMVRLGGQDGVVITYQQYRKGTRLGDVQVHAGAIMVHQILNINQFSGASRRVFRQVIAQVAKPSGGDLYLSVRSENTVAILQTPRHEGRGHRGLEEKNDTGVGLSATFASVTAEGGHGKRR